MIIVMRSNIGDTELGAVTSLIASLKLTAHVSRGAERTIVGVVGAPADKETLLAQFAALDGVESVVPISKTYKLVSREARSGRSVVTVRPGVAFGGDEIVVCAGPCSVESREQLELTAAAISRAGATVLRGGAFKPRTSPYAFQGLGEEGLKFLRDAADRYGLAVVTEVLDTRDVELVSRYADILQIGARNMQNFSLLREAGGSPKPVLLKRGLAATIDEWLMAAEYIVVAGNHNVILCERGIRSFDPQTRNVLDIAARAGRARPHPSARDRRSLARHRHTRARRPDELCGRCGRCRRFDRRGPSESGCGALRRPAVANVRKL